MSEAVLEVPTNAAPIEPSVEELASKLFVDETTASEPKAEGVEKPEQETEETPKAEPEAPPVDDKVSKKIAIAKRAELRAAEERRALRQEQEQLRAGHAALEAKAKAIEEREAQFRLLEQDPVKAFEVLKLDPRTTLERLAAEHDPSKVVTKQLTEMQKALEAERAERIRIQQDQMRREQMRALETESKQAKDAFLDHVAAKVEAYPHLTEEFTPEEIVERAWRVASQHAEAYRKEFGEYPSDEVIAEYLEGEAKARAESKSAWRERLGKRANTPSQGKSAGDSSAAQSVKGSSPRTLTARGASEKASAPKAWSQESADEESLRILEQALRSA